MAKRMDRIPFAGFANAILSTTTVAKATVTPPQARISTDRSYRRTVADFHASNLDAESQQWGSSNENDSNRCPDAPRANSTEKCGLHLSRRNVDLRTACGRSRTPCARTGGAWRRTG